MLSTATTRIGFPERRDGGLRDPDPARRAERLAAAGLSVQRDGRFGWSVVRAHVGPVARSRTRGGAERLAHRRAQPVRPEPVHFHQGPNGDPAPCFEGRCDRPHLAV